MHTALAITLAAPTLIAAAAVWAQSAATPVHHSSASIRPSLAELYALAAEKMLAGHADEPMYLVPTDSSANARVRPRRASGPPYRASAATTRHVVTILYQHGVVGVRGVRTAVGSDDVLHLVLGELRFEPETPPNFARLKITVVGVGGHYAIMEFLLKREPDGWRALSMRSSRPLVADFRRR